MIRQRRGHSPSARMPPRSTDHAAAGGSAARPARSRERRRAKLAAQALPSSPSDSSVTWNVAARSRPCRTGFRQERSAQPAQIRLDAHARTCVSAPPSPCGSPSRAATAVEPLTFTADGRNALELCGGRGARGARASRQCFPRVEPRLREDPRATPTQVSRRRPMCCAQSGLPCSERTGASDIAHRHGRIARSAR
jgi:hypothetical protein